MLPGRGGESGGSGEGSEETGTKGDEYWGSGEGSGETGTKGDEYSE